MSRYKIIRSNFIPPGPRILPRCFIYRRAKAALNPPSPTVDKPAVPAGPKKDYTLKEGQTFSINIPGREKKAPTGEDLLGSGTGSSKSLAGGGLGIPLLPPPPSSKRRS